MLGVKDHETAIQKFFEKHVSDFKTCALQYSAPNGVKKPIGNVLKKIEQNRPKWRAEKKKILNQATNHEVLKFS